MPAGLCPSHRLRLTVALPKDGPVLTDSRTSHSDPAPAFPLSCASQGLDHPVPSAAADPLHRIWGGRHCAPGGALTHSPEHSGQPASARQQAASEPQRLSKARGVAALTPAARLLPPSGRTAQCAPQHNSRGTCPHLGALGTVQQYCHLRGQQRSTRRDQGELPVGMPPTTTV
jgi:hypothetical protein